LGYRAKPLKDAARIEMGEVLFEVLATSGRALRAQEYAQYFDSTAKDVIACDQSILP
jgi:hypothetical protein